MIVIVYVVGLMVYLVCPLLMQIIFAIINYGVSDPIPVIDEIVMTAGMLSRMSKLGSFIEFVSEHKFLTLVIIVAVIGLISNFIV